MKLIIKEVMMECKMKYWGKLFIVSTFSFPLFICLCMTLFVFRDARSNEYTTSDQTRERINKTYAELELNGKVNMYKM